MSSSAHDNDFTDLENTSNVTQDINLDRDPEANSSPDQDPDISTITSADILNDSLGGSVMMLLEHSQVLQEIEMKNSSVENGKSIKFLPGGASPEESDDVTIKLEKLKQEIDEGIKEGKVVEEMQNIVTCISEIQKEMQIRKLMQQQQNSRSDNDEYLMSDWTFMEIVENDLPPTAMESLRQCYANTCQQINVLRKPVRPIFVILQWCLKIYTTGMYSILPIVLKLLAA